MNVINNEMKKIKNAINRLINSSEEPLGEKMQKLNEALCSAIRRQGEFLMQVKLDEDGEIEFFQAVNDDEENRFYTCFTDIDELEKGEGDGEIINMDVVDVLDMVMLNPDLSGLVINPWENALTMPRDWVENVLLFNCIERDGDNSMDIGQLDLTWLNCDAIVKVSECKPNMSVDFGEAMLKETSKIKAKHIIEMIIPPFYDDPEVLALLRENYWNSLECAKKNNLHAIAFAPIADAEKLIAENCPKKEVTEMTAKIIADWVKVNPDYKVNITLSCPDDETEKLMKDAWAYQEKIFDIKVIPGAADNELLEKAIQFAMKKHSGAVRKGTDKAYILHPLEVMNILAAMGADTNLMAAGVLHDTIEDTKTDLLEIRDAFGVDVASLVNFVSEDKRQPWYVRKLHSVMSLEVANGREQMLVMADRIANLRSMWHDGLTAGAELWERFNAPKEMIAWYYSKTIDGLGELEDVCETAPLYQEMNTLFKDLFVTFLLDEKNEILYQIADDPTSPIFVLTKKNPNWLPLQEDISEEAEQVSRKYAERMEENWLDILQKILEKDIQGGDYQIYTGSGRNLAVSIANGCMTFMGYDYDETGAEPDYEYYYNLDEEDTGYILFSLRVEYGTTMKIETLLRKAFGTKNGAVRFTDYCKEHGVDVGFNAY